MSRIPRNYKFYDSSKENPKRSFALYDFPLLLRFSHLPEGVLNYTNSAKIEKNGDHDHSLQFTFFCSLLVCLASQTSLPNLTNFAKTVKNREPNYFSHLTICRYFIVFLSDLPDGASEFNKFWENGEKSLSKRLVVLYDFSLLLCFVLLREGPPNLTNSAKSAENCSVSPLSYFSLRLPHHFAEPPM